MRIRQALATALVTVPLLVSGCSTADDGVTVLRINTGVPPTHHLTVNVFTPWAESVAEATDGRVRVQLYDTETLGSLTTSLADIQGGLYDAAPGIPAFFPESTLFPLTIGNLISASPDLDLGNQLIDTYYRGVSDQVDPAGSLVAGVALTTPYVVLSKERLSSVRDLAGLQVRVGSDLEAEAVRLFGANPVQLPVAETYQGLERDVVDAAFFPAETALALRLPEVAPYLLDLQVAANVTGQVVSTAFLDDLSAADRAAFDDELLPELGELTRESYLAVEAANEEGIALAEEVDGLQVTEVPDADRAVIADAAQAQWTEWAARADGLGLDGEALVEEYLTVMDELGAPRPF